MNWDRIESNWAQCTGNSEGRWGQLTDGQIAGRVQDTYEMATGEEYVQHQLTDWQKRLNEIERTAQ